MGVMVDHEAHCLPAATILDGVAVNWGWGSLILEIPVPSSCSSSATVSGHVEATYVDLLLCSCQ